MTNKEKKELTRQRVKWEFELRLNEFIRNFKSKEEPEVNLTKTEITQVLVEMVGKNIN